MGKWLMRLAIPAGIVAAIVALRLTVLAPDPVSVRTVGVERGRVESTVTNSRAGTVKARQRAKLSPDTGGQVVALPFAEGARVRRGDVLLRLEDASQRAQLALRRQEVVAAQAERERLCLMAERAARELDRLARLAREEIVSADLLDGAESARLEAEAACRSAGANVSRAEAALELARTELAKRVLAAPFDGVIAEISTEVGEWVTPSPPALPVPAVIDILDPGAAFIRAPMDEVDSARIRVGQPARVTVDSHRGESFAGIVERVAPYVLDLEAQNRTVEIDVELDDPARASRLLPGTSADVEIVLEVRDDVLRIPTAALVEGSRVLLLDGETLVERDVETALRNWDYTEVVAGLDEGERVVVSLDRAEVAAGARAREAAAGGE